jgi:arabinogalactan endo-1,4-beta-galactosidase
MALNQAKTLSLTSMSKNTISKIVLGAASLMIVALIGITGVAGATQGDKPSKEECVTAGFTNYGQCVKEWAQDKNNGNNGYGGGNNAIHTNINVDQNGDNNVFSVIINYFFG